MNSASHSANAEHGVGGAAAGGQQPDQRDRDDHAAAITSGTIRMLVGVEQRDHEQRADVVDDGQREQEDPQPGRVLRSDDGQRADEERGVGGDHHTPGLRVVAATG